MIEYENEILMALSDKWMSSKDVNKSIDGNISTTRKHLNIMFEAGLITSRNYGTDERPRYFWRLPITEKEIKHSETCNCGICRIERENRDLRMDYEISIQAYNGLLDKMHYHIHLMEDLQTRFDALHANFIEIMEMVKKK